MKTYFLCITAALIAASALMAAAASVANALPCVSNVAVAQRPGTGLVDIRYDVSADTGAVNVSVVLSAAGVVIPAEALSGDVGAGVAPGAGKCITWDAGTEWPGRYVPNVMVSVTADNGKRVEPQPDKYLVIDLSGGPDAESYPVTTLPDVPDGGWTNAHKTTKLVLRRIPAGTFMMGMKLVYDKSGNRIVDTDCHLVTLAQDFYMGVFEVTQRQYELVMGENPSEHKGGLRPVDRTSYAMLRGAERGGQWPLNNTVDDASFFGRLRAKASLVADLPTEAQWEYACRAGTTTGLNSGKELKHLQHAQCPNMDEAGRYRENQKDGKGGYTNAHTRVGSYPPNAWGLYDMHGNVWEWCLDWYGEGSLGTDAVTDPKGVAVNSCQRVLRGGGHSEPATFCISSWRAFEQNGSSRAYAGFRVCVAMGYTHTEQSASSLVDTRAYAADAALFVSNVTAVQRPGTSLVDIRYDVIDTRRDTLDISVRLSADGVTIPAAALSGDVGTGIKPGRGKRVTWDMGKDLPGQQIANVAASVTAAEAKPPAALTAEYCVIDLSGGPHAVSYPVATLSEAPSGGWTDEYKTTKLVLRKIPKGTFMMGSPPTEQGRRKTSEWNRFQETSEDLHQVTLTQDFYIGVFEVTQKQYELVMGNNPSAHKGDMRPVEGVSYEMIRGAVNGAHWPVDNWVDAASFFGKVRAKTPLTADLPTEAQWEYACRAGTVTALNSGKELTATITNACPNLNEVARNAWNATRMLGWSDPDGKGGYENHTTVGMYRPNTYGLYDMHGNVQEWCLDWHANSLVPVAATDPAGPALGLNRCMRGGSFNQRVIRSSKRDDCVRPYYVSPSVGFRACVLPGPETHTAQSEPFTADARGTAIIIARDGGGDAAATPQGVAQAGGTTTGRGGGADAGDGTQEALPLTAYGVFNGFVYDDTGVYGLFSATVSDTGKISAKVVSTNGIWQFSAPSWAGKADGVYTADLENAKGHTLALALDSAKPWNDWQMSGQINGTYDVYAQRNPYINKNDATYGEALTALNLYAGYYLSLAFEDAPTPDTEGGFITATVGENGSVKLAGKLADGTAVSGSTTLIMGEGKAVIPCFVPLYNAKGFVSGVLLVNTKGVVDGESWRIEGN